MSKLDVQTQEVTQDLHEDLIEDIVLPPYVPTIEETFKASGAHRQRWLA